MARDLAQRNAWSRVRICTGCAKEETVRKDNTAALCASCGSLHGRARWEPQRGLRLPGGRNRTADRVHRSCETCTGAFWVYASTLRHSNSSGRFCSIPCYRAHQRQAYG